jgi:MEKHLA domain
MHDPPPPPPRPRYLLEASFDVLARAVFAAPFVCLAHSAEGWDDGDPRFTYANRAALELFEASWDELIGLPSRRSADEDAQAVRAHEGAVCLQQLVIPKRRQPLAASLQMHNIPACC